MPYAVCRIVYYAYRLNSLYSFFSELQSGLSQIKDTINKLSASLMNVFPAH